MTTLKKRYIRKYLPLFVLIFLTLPAYSYKFFSTTLPKLSYQRNYSILRNAGTMVRYGSLLLIPASCMTKGKLEKEKGPIWGDQQQVSDFLQSDSESQLSLIDDTHIAFQNGVGAIWLSEHLINHGSEGLTTGTVVAIPELTGTENITYQILSDYPPSHSQDQTSLYLELVSNHQTVYTVEFINCSNHAVMNIYTDEITDTHSEESLHGSITFHDNNLYSNSAETDEVWIRRDTMKGDPHCEKLTRTKPNKEKDRAEGAQSGFQLDCEKDALPLFCFSLLDSQPTKLLTTLK